MMKCRNLGMKYIICKEQLVFDLTICRVSYRELMMTSISSLFQVGLFHKYNFVESHLTRETRSLGFSKMWSTIYSPSKLTAILGNLFRFQLIKNQQNF